MEILGILSSFMLAIVIAVVVLLLVWAYALQCLATKNEMSSVGEILAWLPILNMYPFIVCCGASFPRFLIGAAVFVVGGIGLGFLSASGETLSMISAGIGLLATLGLLFYFGRLFWGMAERRGLPGFIGLLNFVPGVNLFVFPYIAFHDGFAPVNKIGAVLGFLLIAGPSFGQYQLINMATSAMEATSETMGDDMLNAMMQPAGSAGTLEGNAAPFASNSAMKTMQLEMRVSMLEALDPSNAEHADRMKTELGAIREEFEALRDSLPKNRQASLRQAITSAELRLVDVQDPNAVVSGSNPQSNPSPQQGFELSFKSEVESDLESDPGKSDSQSAQASASAPPAAPASSAAPETVAVFDPQRGFPVPDPGDMICGPGTTQLGDATTHVWCQQQDSGLQHGWSSERHGNGKVAVAGQYHDGMRHGVWSRWYEDGGLRAQAEFKHGLQDGRLVAWDRSGRITTDLFFQEGEPAQR